MRRASREGSAPRPSILPRSFYDRSTLSVAEDLLGKVLAQRTPGGVTAGMIVETEAYIGEDDPACHASSGPTPRNAPLYGPPSMAYFYLNYGIHYLINAVTEAAGCPAAVLIRALQPLAGAALMMKRRAPGGRRVADADLCRGPGNVTRALGITLVENGVDLTRGPASGHASSHLSIEDCGLTPGRISRGPRVGIRVGVERPWRAGSRVIRRSRARSGADALFASTGHRGTETQRKH